jgi:hypothetical protein
MPSRLFVPNAVDPIYEFDPSEVVSDTPPSVVWIRRKMNMEISGKVSSELVKLGDDRQLESHLGANQTALLIYNIVKWEGPLFVETDDDDQPILDGHGREKPIPCTPANIRQLDPNDPFIAAVLEAIAVRNKKRESPKAPTESAIINGSTSSGDPDSIESPITPRGRTSLTRLSVNGQSKSSLLTAVGGHLNRSEDSTPTT